MNISTANRTGGAEVNDGGRTGFIAQGSSVSLFQVTVLVCLWIVNCEDQMILEFVTLLQPIPVPLTHLGFCVGCGVATITGPRSRGHLLLLDR